MRTIPLRPIDLKWTCHRSGDCCRNAGAVVMLPQERDLLLERRPDLAPRFEVGAGGFVGLLCDGGGCPLLTIDAAGLATCTVHDIRPLNCRRFVCGRPDVKAEPFEMDPPQRHESVMGCANLTDRVLQSRPFRRLYAQLQRKTMQAWGLKHGWNEVVR